jgi:hypothetical protein
VVRKRKVAADLKGLFCQNFPESIVTNVIVKFFKRIHFSQIDTITMHIKFCQQHCNVYIALKLYTVAGFEPGIFCSVGRRDDHYATL